VPILIAQAGLADACGPDPGFLCELVYDQTGSETLAELAEVLVVPLKIVVILLLAWLLNRVARRAIARATEHLVAQTESLAAAGADLGDQASVRASLQRRALDRARRMAEMSARAQQRARTLGAVLRSVTAIVIFTIAGLMMLGEVDINLGPLVAGAGIAGIAIGFGAQSLVKDFLSGIFMLIEDQYGVGDIVDVGEAAGVVEQVNLRTTRLRDVNGTLWHVPNGEIRRVGNKSQDWARTVLDVEVSYDTDIDRATSVIKRVADSVWEDDLPEATVLEEPEIWGVEMFGENAIVIRLAMKTEPAEQFTVARLVRRRLKEAFDREGIEIPFPQRTIWLKGQPGAIEAFAPPAERLGAEEAAVEAAAEPGKEAASGPEEVGD
jgi:small conductance mechanosensitive channel